MRANPPAPPQEFLAGRENALAVAAANALGEPDSSVSPLVLYGSTGVGKTLLALGLADCWRMAHPADRVLATNGSDFARDFAQAVSADAADDFTFQQRQCQLLVVDDLDQMAGKPSAQESLLYTLDVLAHRGATVIITMHACPGEGIKLSRQLVSRLLGGLVVPLTVPALETRAKIVEHLTAQLGADLDAATRWLADHPQSSLAKLRFVVEQLARRPSEDNAAWLADDALHCPETPTISQIAAVVARQFHLRQAVVKGTSRRATAVLARGLAMLAARRYCQMSYQEIGRHFGRRDHTTVLHACRKLESLLKTDQLVVAAWRQMTLDLNVACGEL